MHAFMKSKTEMEMEIHYLKEINGMDCNGHRLRALPSPVGLTQGILKKKQGVRIYLGLLEMIDHFDNILRAYRQRCRWREKTNEVAF